MDKLRVLILGAAFSAELHMDAYARLRDKAQIVGIADKNPDRIKALSEKYGITDFKAYDDFKTAIGECDCDLVDICLPNFLHHDPAMLAFEKGKSIICEKPLATTLEDGKEMVEAANKANVHIYYAEDWLFAPAVQKALALIEEGGIGDVKFVRARECHCGSHSPFAQTVKFCGGGSMIHLGIHPIGLMMALKDNKWSEIAAMTSGGGERNLIHKTLEGEDWGAVLMRFEDGTTAVLEGNYVTSGGMEDSISFYGTKGCLHVDLTFSSALSGFSIDGFSYTVEKAETNKGWSRPAVDEKYNVGYVAEITHFVECALEKKASMPGTRGIDGLACLSAVTAAYEAAKTGITVKK